MNTFTASTLGLAFLISVFDFCSSTSATKTPQTAYTSAEIKSNPEPSYIVFPDREDHSHYNYHHHHHHHDHYDLGYPHQEIDARHPQTTAKTTTTTEKIKYRNAFENSTGIPLDFLEKLNNNRYTVNDLLLHYVDDYEDTLIRSRFGEEERRSAIIPKDAKCLPELTTIKLATSEDPNVLFIPACTRIERCGGCCSHSLLSCQPTEVETINYQVIKTRYTGGSKLKYLEKEIIPVDKHIKCACDCRVQPQDCTPMQEYHKNECKCICRNVDEEKKCYKSNDTRLWDPQSCSCKCREERVCSTGTVFDWNQCKCVLIPMKRRFAEYPRSRTSYKSEARPVIPLQYNNNNNNN